MLGNGRNLEELHFFCSVPEESSCEKIGSVVLVVVVDVTGRETEKQPILLTTDPGLDAVRGYGSLSGAGGTQFISSVDYDHSVHTGTSWEGTTADKLVKDQEGEGIHRKTQAQHIVPCRRA